MKVVLAVLVTAVASAGPAFAQVEVSGHWRAILHEESGLPVHLESESARLMERYRRKYAPGASA